MKYWRSIAHSLAVAARLARETKCSHGTTHKIDFRHFTPSERLALTLDPLINEGKEFNTIQKHQPAGCDATQHITA